MKQNIKEQLIRSVSAIKNKLKQMRDDEDKMDWTMNKVLKPVVEPMKLLMEGDNKKKMEKIISASNYKDTTNISNTSTSSSIYEDLNESQSSFSDDYKDTNITAQKCSNTYLDKAKSLERSLNKEDIEDIYDGINIPFGVRKENSDFLMGNTKINVRVFNNPLDNKPKQVITINTKNYELTPGLKELLLRKTPNLSLVTTNDQTVYKDMLNDTNAHKRHYNPNGQIKGDRSVKYREIIRPLFLEVSNNANDLVEIGETKFGTGLPTLKEYKPYTDFVFWDDPNELIERLKMLIASRDAGNRNHDNEIISIIEELKEADIIKE